MHHRVCDCVICDKLAVCIILFHSSSGSPNLLSSSILLSSSKRLICLLFIPYYTTFSSNCKGIFRDSHGNQFSPQVQNSTNRRAINEAIEHDIGDRTFCSGILFEKFDKIDSSLTEHIEILLNGFIFNYAPVFLQKHIKKPVHSFS